jgi:hypothetical protein
MPIKMKALKPFGVAGINEGHVKRGREFSVASDHRRRELEAHGLAYRLDMPALGAPAAKDGASVNEAADLGPFDSAGGETGAAGPAPSSPQGRRRRSRRSDNSEDGFLR